MKKTIGIISKPKMKKNQNIWNKMYIADELRYLDVNYRYKNVVKY